MRKSEAIAYLESKIGDDEPVFVLRGRDRCAPKTVRQWASFAWAEGAPPEKRDSALEIALAMDEWARAEDRGRWPD